MTLQEFLDQQEIRLVYIREQHRDVIPFRSKSTAKSNAKSLTKLGVKLHLTSSDNGHDLVVTNWPGKEE